MDPDLERASLTRAVGFGSFRVQGFGAQWSTRLQLGFRELRQVSHDRVLIHIRVHNFLRSYNLHRGQVKGVKGW